MSDRSTNQIEREVEAQRYEVEETIEALRSKLSTGQILDMVAKQFSGASGHGNEFVSNLGRQIKENPLPIALTGVGLAWLLMSQNKEETHHAQLPAPREIYPATPMAYDRDRYAADETSRGSAYAVSQLKSGAYDLRDSARRAGGTAYDHARYAADETKHGADYAVGQLKAGAYSVQAGASSAASKTYDTAKFAADEAKHGAKYVGDQLKAGAYSVQESASAAADAVYDKARIAADEVRYGAAYVSDQLKAGAYSLSDAASSAYASARDATHDAAASARVAGQRAQRNVTDFIAQEPLIAGALGIALGAALGALLPATRQEDELMGPYRDKLRDDAMDYASEQAERAERVATESLSAAEQKAREEGLIPEGGDKTIAEKAENVVKAAKDKAKEKANS